MKKVTVLTLSRHREETLRALRSLGVVHVEPLERPEGQSVETLRNERGAVEQIVNHLERRRAELPDETGTRAPEGRIAESDGNPIPRITAWMETRKSAAERRDQVERQIQATQPLGDFDPANIAKLESRGIRIRLYRRSGRQAAEVLGSGRHVLHRDRRQTIYALIGSGEPLPGDQAVALPERSLAAMRREHDELQTRMSAADRDLNAAVRHLPRLRRILRHKTDALRFAETSAGMGKRESVVYLKGYCPAESLEAMRTAARDHGWGLRVEDPRPGDTVPTLIRHPAWVRPIKAVMNLMGILPGYHEIDISAAFLLFFSLFFAMIVGDAGYGLIFLGLTALAQRRWRRAAPPEPFRLMTTLGLATVAWGLLNGNFFGTSLFQPLIPWLTERENLMLLCFLIGAVHLSLAHAWNALTIINTTPALAQAGWIGLTWFMFLTARSLILGASFPPWGFLLLTVSLLTVIVFMTPPRLFKTEWVAHAMLPLTVINNFVDVVSYVRLFAVGYATVAVAQAFNSMAVSDEMSIARGLVAPLVLFVGHALNIMLCALSVLVHGLRLNTLEFSGHVGMQWTGFKYRPFAPEPAGAEQQP